MIEPIVRPAAAVELLGRCALLAGADRRELEALAQACAWGTLPGGRSLFETGDVADAAYVLGAGRVEVHHDDELLAERGPGDVVGEAGLLGSGRRQASVTAVRDTLLARIEARTLDELARTLPELSRMLAAEVARRLSAGPVASRRMRAPRLVALVAGCPAVDATDLGERLVRAVPGGVRAQLVPVHVAASWQALEAHHVTELLAAHEARNDLVVLCVDPQVGDAGRLVRQADLVLVAGRAGHRRSRWASDLLERSDRPVQLLLSRVPGAPPSTGGWPAALGVRPARAVLHLVDGRHDDLARVARRLTGRAVGVVLGGGGARGFAHLGAVRALLEAGVPIDRVGGSSMGAIIGAQVAMGWTPDRLLEENRRAWSRRTLFEPSWTGISVARGERAAALLGRFFGDLRIPELPIEYFCTTADLTACRLNVADRGRVADWVAASAAVPGLWPPFVDGRGHLHADGGVLDNVPTAIMATRLAGPVVAVDVCSTQSPMLAAPAPGGDGALAPLRVRRGERGVGAQVPSLVEVLGRSNLLAGMQTLARARHHADLYLTPHTAPHGFTAFDRVAELAELGYRSTLDQLGSVELGAVLQPDDRWRSVDERGESVGVEHGDAPSSRVEESLLAQPPEHLGDGAP